MNDTVEQPTPDAPPAAATPSDHQPEAAAPADAPKPASERRSWFSPWLLIALLALALSGWQWYETRNRLAGTQQETARRLADADTVVKENRALARHAQEQVDQMQGKLGALEGKIAESTSQQAALENLYKDLAGNREEWILAEIEQGVTLAAQQLQLAANVPAAVLALQAADARLAGSSRPQFIALRKVIGGDLDRLRALPQVDLPGMSVRLERVIAAVGSLPLAVEVRPQQTESAGSADSADSASSVLPITSWEGLNALRTLSFWQQLGGEFWNEFRGLIRIQRFDRNEPALLAPSQDYFLRENLKLRLLNARLALLSHDQWLFRNELTQATALVSQYFNTQEQTVRTVQESLRQLSAAEIIIEVPNLNDSLSAIKNFKSAKDPA